MVIRCDSWRSLATEQCLHHRSEPPTVHPHATRDNIIFAFCPTSVLFLSGKRDSYSHPLAWHSFFLTDRVRSVCTNTRHHTARITDIPRRQLSAPENPLLAFSPSLSFSEGTSHLHLLLHLTYVHPAHSQLRITENVKYWLNLHAAPNTVHGKRDTCMQQLHSDNELLYGFQISREKFLDFWWLSDVILDFVFFSTEYYLVISLTLLWYAFFRFGFI